MSRSSATLSIAVQECRRLFSGLLGWSVLAATQMLLCLVMISVLSGAAANPKMGEAIGMTEILVSSLFGIAAFLLLLLIPLLTMRTLAEEHRNGSLVLLLSAPVSAVRIIVGKLIGVTLPIIVLTMMTAGMVASLSIGTTIDWGRLAAATAGLLLLGTGFAAAGVAVSASTRNPSLAAFLSLVLLLSLWLLAVLANLGLSIHIAGLRIDVSAAAGWLSPIPHYETMIHGIVDSRDLVYFLHFILLFAGLATLRLKSARGTVHPGWRRSAAGFGWALVVGLSAMLFTGIETQQDLTWNDAHTLHRSSAEVLESMPEPVHLRVISAPTADRRSEMERLLGRYARVHPEFTWEFVDPASIPDEMLRPDRSVDHAVIHYADRTESVALSDEETLTAALFRLSRNDQQWIFFTRGHGERDLTDEGAGGYALLAERLRSQGFGLMQLSLADSGGVPDNASVVVVAGSRRSWLPGEVAALQAFLHRGGSLLMLNDPEGSAPELPSLPFAWQTGTVVLPDYRQIGLPHPAVVVATEYENHPVSDGLSGYLLLPGSRGLTSVAQTTWSASNLIKSPARSWLEQDALNDEIRFESAAGDIAGPIVVAAAATHEKTGQRIVFVGDSDFAGNGTYQNHSNADWTTSVFNWLTRRDDAPRLVRQRPSDASLEIGATASRLLVGSHLSIALLIIGCGIWRHRRRTRR